MIISDCCDSEKQEDTLMRWWADVDGDTAYLEEQLERQDRFRKEDTDRLAAEYYNGEKQ